MSESDAELPLVQAKTLLRQRLRGQVWELHILRREGGVILQGHALSYYAKQLAQHIAMHELQLTIVANEIEVRPALPTQDPGGDLG